MKWTIEEEKELIRLTENAWDWSFPGWDWVLAHLETDYPNGRTVSSICNKYGRLIDKRNKSYVSHDFPVVSLEKAKQLKAKGFNKPTYYYYLGVDIPFVKKGLYRVKDKAQKMNHNRYDEFVYSAPFLNDLK